MPNMLYEHVIEVNERVVPHIDANDEKTIERIVTLPNGKKVTNLNKTIFFKRINFKVKINN